MNIVTTTTEVPYVTGTFPWTYDRSRADPDCWRAFTDYSLTCILRNLAVAGALCAAFNQRLDREYSVRNWDWKPGCRRSWP